MLKYIILGLVVGLLSYLSTQTTFKLTKDAGPERNESLLVIGIMSAQQNFEARQSIRNTWLSLSDQHNVKGYFIIGETVCDVPHQDRISQQSCEHWTVDIRDTSRMSIGELTHGVKKINMYAGFTFHVLHPIILHGFKLHSQYVSSSANNLIRVSLYNTGTSVREKIVSASFYNSNKETISKPVEPYLLPRGFEGMLIVEENLISEFGCSMLWNNGSGLITFQQLIEDIKEKPVAFHSGSCVPVSLSFSIHDREGLQKHLAQEPQRKENWQNKVEIIKGKLIEESSLYKDILFVNIIDVYRNLPRKVLHFFRWAHSNLNFTYLMKTDDDTFVNIAKVTSNLKDFQKENQQQLHWWSSFREGWVVQAFGKWREDIYRSTTYPPFPCGAGYILSRELVQFLGHDAYDFLYKDFQGEDVSLGIWLAGLNPVRYSGSCTWACDDKCDPNACNRPELSVTQMYNTWKTFKQCNNICKC